MPFEAKVRLGYMRVANEHDAKITNISMRGAFISTEKIIPPGSIISLYIESPRIGGAIIATGRVVRCEVGQGVGVEFIEMSPNSAACIDRIVREYDPPSQRLLTD